MNDQTYNFLRSALVYEIFPRTHSPSRNLAGIIPDLPRIAALGTDFLFVRNMVTHMKQIKKDCRVCYSTEITRGVVKIDWVGPSASYSAILNLENRFGQIPVNFRLVGQDLLSGQPCDIANKFRIPSHPLLVRKAPGTDPGMASRFGWHV
jgi:hypothetical protein